MVDFDELARTVAMAGGGFAAFTFAIDRTLATAERLGAVPARFNRWSTKRAESAHDRRVREDALTALLSVAQVAPAVATLGKKADLIVAAISPNGGDSLRDAITRIEGNLLDHIVSSDRVEARVYEEIAEMGAEVDVLSRMVRGQGLAGTR